MTELESTFEMWALVEMPGYRKETGWVTKADFPPGWIRLDIPKGLNPADGFAVTRFYNPATGYGITPITEQLARAFAAGHPTRPIATWEVPELAERTRAALSDGHAEAEVPPDEAPPDEEERVPPGGEYELALGDPVF